MANKILIISQNFYPEIGTAANRMKSIFKILRSKGIETTVLTTDPTYPTKKLFDDRSYFIDQELNSLEEDKIIRLKMFGIKQNKNIFMRTIYYVEQYFRIRKFLKNSHDKYDYIYVSSPNIFLAWATLFLKKSKKPIYILEIRDLWPDSVNEINEMNIKLFMPFLKYLEKKMYNAADKIIINNEAFRNHINNKLHKHKPIFFLPNGISEREITVSKRKEDFSVIYAGNIGYAQDVKKMIEICKLLDSKKINITAIIYGIRAHTFRKAVKNLKFVSIKKPMDRLSCLEEISKHHVSLAILQESDVFMNAMPGKVLDSISVGTPVVSNIDGPISKIINEYNLGFSKGKASVEKIVEEIELLKKDKMNFKKKSENALNYRNYYLIWEKNIEGLIIFLSKR